MMGYGVYRFVGAGDATDGLWWIVLGWMLGGSARAAVAQSRFADRLDGVTAGDIMDSEPVTIPAELPVERAYDEFFLRYQGWPWFAVVETTGTSPASPTARRSSTPRSRRTRRSPSATSSPPPSAVRTDTPLESLIGNEPLRTLGALMAVDAEGRLRGVVTRRAGHARAFRRAWRNEPKAIVRACPHTTC